jgi:hypothetical protein
MAEDDECMFPSEIVLTNLAVRESMSLKTLYSSFFPDYFGDLILVLQRIRKGTIFLLISHWVASCLGRQVSRSSSSVVSKSEAPNTRLYSEKNGMMHKRMAFNLKRLILQNWLGHKLWTLGSHRTSLLSQCYIALIVVLISIPLLSWTRKCAESHLNNPISSRQ